MARCVGSDGNAGSVAKTLLNKVKDYDDDYSALNTAQTMTRVGIVNGIARLNRYNKNLGSLYQEGVPAVVGTKQYKFPTHLLFCCHLHSQLTKQVEEIVHENDIIHCQSSSFFPILPYMQKHGIKKPLIMESPVLKSHTGTLYAATNKAKHYKDVKQNPFINFMLDTFSFTPKWTLETLVILKDMKEAGNVLVLHSKKDGVSDIEGLEGYFNHIFKDGPHARLFDAERDIHNDFSIVSEYVQNYGKK